MRYFYAVMLVAAAFVSTLVIAYTFLQVAELDSVGDAPAGTVSDPESGIPESLPPSAPSGISATSASASQIDISWSPPSTAAGVAGYIVFRNGVQIAVTNTTSYADTGLSSSTTYSYVIVAFDKSGNLSPDSSEISATTQGASVPTVPAPSAPSASPPPPQPGAQAPPPPPPEVQGPENVTWINLVNSDSSVTGLSKASGCDGCQDAGAVSAQSISGNGYFEFSMPVQGKLGCAGIGPGGNATTRAEIDFALCSLGPGSHAEVRENGVYKADTFSIGALLQSDILRISVNNSVVSYSKSGVVFYTSSSAPAYPLFADAVLYNTGTIIGSAMISHTETVIFDTAPPVISGVSSVTASTSANVSWSTDEPADSRVEFLGTCPGSACNFSSSALTASHNIHITGFSPGTAYTYRVASIDAAGNSAISGNFSLVTLSSVEPSNVTTLPQIFLDTTYAPPSGAVISVSAGGNFQSALDSANPGDIIELAAGATYQGNFVLPNKAGTGWIYVRSSMHASLPPPGNRVAPSDSALMPRIISADVFNPAITAAPGAHNYRFVGIEITTTHSSTSSTYYNVIDLGSSASSLQNVPSNIIFDRSYIHGTPGGNVRRGIAMNSANTSVVDSYLSDFHEVGADSQAIAGWNGPGPYKIVNNYIEGAGENMIFGGSDPLITNLVPSDIEIRGNHFYKPLSWRIGDPSYSGIPWSVKNIFELKNARRVLIEGNVFENNWLHAQNGFGILFIVRNQDGNSPWSVVEDVTFRKNVVRHSGSGVNVNGVDDIHPSQQNRRILIKDNLFEDINGTKWGGSGILFQIVTASGKPGVDDLVIDHNTALHTGHVIATGPSGTTHDLVYTNNIARHNEFGVGGDATYGNPNLTLATYFPGHVFTKNILTGGNSNSYPAGNFFPVSLGSVGFANMPAGDYSLSQGSAYRNAGTDGKDLGANIAALNPLVSCALAGTCV